MNDRLVVNARIVRTTGVQSGGVLIRDGCIAQVFDSRDIPTGFDPDDILDIKGEYLAPGLIDIHIHGSVGIDVQAADLEGLAKLSTFLLSQGVTGYFPTLVPAEDDDYRRARHIIETFRTAPEAGAKQGARVLGLHFEGPFLNKHKCGALHPDQFRSYEGDPRSIALFLEPAISGSMLMTLAPEVPGGIDLTRALESAGARAFIGHTQADPGMLDLALQCGARHITHFPNALDPLHHRKPGAALWGLLNDVTIDCIADLHHVDPMMLRLMYRLKGADRMALVSDAIMPAGMGDGEFTVWGDRIDVLNGRTSLVEGPASGSLAGSVITMRQAVKNVMSLGVRIHEAIQMASLVPARAAGIEREYGSIEVGKRAHLFAFDEDFNVRLTILDGQVTQFV